MHLTPVVVACAGTHYIKMTFHEKAHILSYVEPYADKFGKWFDYFAADVVRPVEFYDRIPKEYGGRALWGACVALKINERKDTEQCLQKIADHVRIGRNFGDNVLFSPHVLFVMLFCKSGFL